jgi:uncharacterized RDD family membrane protein YckC
VQLFILLVLTLITGAAVAGGGMDSAAAAALLLTATVLVIVGYPVILETLTRGRSLGKLALGLRVVSDDGGPERFRQALVRGLAAVVEIWALLGFPALICSLLSARGKRLGDVFAGTFVLQQRMPARHATAAAQVAVPPALAGWAAGLELTGMTDHLAETVRRYLARMPELTPAARTQLAERIAAEVSTRVSPPPPPGTPAADYLSAVLAERRSREQSRLLPAAAAAGPAPGGTGTYGIMPAPPPAGGPGQPAGGPGQPAGGPGQPAGGQAAAGQEMPGHETAGQEGDGSPPESSRPGRAGGFAPPG